ncbi:MAG: MerR family transcriptional regulator [Planctomycetota bacterium]
MSLDELLSEYEKLLECQRQAAMEQLRIENQVRVLERRMELARPPKPAEFSTTQFAPAIAAFISSHREDLTDADVQFLTQEERGRDETIEQLGVSASQLRRLAERGVIACRKNSRGHRRYRTLSVIQYLVNGETATQSEQDLDPDGPT